MQQLATEFLLTHTHTHTHTPHTHTHFLSLR